VATPFAKKRVFSQFSVFCFFKIENLRKNIPFWKFLPNKKIILGFTYISYRLWSWNQGPLFGALTNLKESTNKEKPNTSQRRM
jgi:hypothetical protein